MAVNTPLTLRAAATSRPNRIRNCGSVASSARMTFTATGRPPAETPRKTRPMPPPPSWPTSRYEPIVCGSPGCNSLTTLPPNVTHTPYRHIRQNNDNDCARELTWARAAVPGLMGYRIPKPINCSLIGTSNPIDPTRRRRCGPWWRRPILALPVVMCSRARRTGGLQGAAPPGSQRGAGQPVGEYRPVPGAFDVRDLIAEPVVLEQMDFPGIAAHRRGGPPGGVVRALPGVSFGGHLDQPVHIDIGGVDVDRLPLSEQVGRLGAERVDIGQQIQQFRSE